MNTALSPFHLAIPVSDLAACRHFYREILGFKEGRSDTHWVDFDFFGHQLVLHYSPEKTVLQHNPVDGEQVPVPHFGVVLPWADWEAFAALLREKEVRFIIEPTVRFAGTPGEQATLFFQDPDGNALEFKAFKNREEQLFAR